MYDNNSKSGNFYKLAGLSVLKPLSKNIVKNCLNCLMSLILNSFLMV